MSDIVSKSEMKRLGTLDPAKLTEDFFRLKDERDRLNAEVDLLRRERDDANDRGDRYKAALEKIHAFWLNIDTPKPYFIGDTCEEALRPIAPDAADRICEDCITMGTQCSECARAVFEQASDGDRTIMVRDDGL